MSQRRLAAIMFTDIVGYTALMGKDEDKAFEILRINREIHQTQLEKYNGTLIKEIGDGILASFSSALEAVQCAIEIQRESLLENISLRIGIHEGEVVFEGTDVMGDGVNIASRLEDEAPPESIVISEAVYNNIKNKSGFSTEFIGEKQLKNVDQPQKLYKVITTTSHLNNILDSVHKHQVKHRLGIPYLAGIGLLIIAAVIVVTWVYKISFPTSGGLKNNKGEEKSIAVLPFNDLSEDKKNQYFCDGIQDGILNNLAKIKELRVSARTSVEKFRTNPPTAREIGKDLDVKYLLEGSVFKSGNKIRVTVQLIDAANDKHLWSEPYDKDLQDVFNVMSEIAKSVATEIEVVISPEVSKNEPVPTVNMEAYDLYLKGREYHMKYSVNNDKSDLGSAIHFYQQAIEKDTKFALAWVWLGTAYHEQTYWSDFFKDKFADTLKYYADKALELNPGLAEGYWLSGNYYYLKGDIGNSISQYKKAIKYNANMGEALRDLGICYRTNEQYADAIFSNEKACKLKTGSPDYANYLKQLAFPYWYMGDIRKADSVVLIITNIIPVSGYYTLAMIAWMSDGDLNEIKHYTDKCCEVDSGIYCLDVLSTYYAQKGDYKAALFFGERWRRLKNETGDIGLYNLHRDALIYWETGRKDKAKELFGKQIKYCKESIRLNRWYALDGMAYYDMAAVYAFLNEKEKAYEILHKLETVGFRAIILSFIKIDPLYKNLRNDEEFRQIVQRQEAKYAKIRKEVNEALKNERQ